MYESIRATGIRAKAKLPVRPHHTAFIMCRRDAYGRDSWAQASLRSIAPGLISYARAEGRFITRTYVRAWACLEQRRSFFASCGSHHRRCRQAPHEISTLFVHSVVLGHGTDVLRKQKWLDEMVPREAGLGNHYPSAFVRVVHLRTPLHELPWTRVLLVLEYEVGHVEWLTKSGKN